MNFFFLLQILHTTKTYSRGENAFKELIQKQEKYNPIHFAHLLHNNTQWSQNKMTSFTIFMAFCLLFYTIYNHFNFISLFLIQGRKKSLCTISHYYFWPSKYRVIFCSYIFFFVWLNLIFFLLFTFFFFFKKQLKLNNQTKMELNWGVKRNPTFL